MPESSKSQLYLTRELAAEYIQLLAEALKVDMEIVDHEINRVIGTGYYENNMRVISDGVIYDEVLRTGRYIVVQNPRKHEICERCSNRDRCLDKMEIACPIIHNEKTIGAIGLVCSTNEQKLRLMENIRTHMFLIAKVCGFLADKVGDCEKIMNQEDKIRQLEQKMTQYMDEGGKDYTGEIRFINDLEKTEILRALNKFGRGTEGKRLAAKSLGIGIATLYRKLDGYGIEK